MRHDQGRRDFLQLFMAQPDFDRMWAAFPDHTKYPTLRALHTFIGGRVAVNIGDDMGFPDAGNTCAMRMSYALNHGGMPLSWSLLKSLKLGRSAIPGADHKPHLFRVADLRIYLANALGTTPQRVRKDFGKAFAGRRGIVAFKVDGWQTATGHIALWNGTQFREDDHDDYRQQRDDPATVQNEGTTVEMLLWPL